MPLRFAIAYGLTALLVLSAVVVVLLMRRARRERDKNHRYVK